VRFRGRVVQARTPLSPGCSQHRARGGPGICQPLEDSPPRGSVEGVIRTANHLEALEKVVVAVWAAAEMPVLAVVGSLSGAGFGGQHASPRWIGVTDRCRPGQALTARSGTKPTPPCRLGCDVVAMLTGYSVCLLVDLLGLARGRYRGRVRLSAKGAGKLGSRARRAPLDPAVPGSRR